jgi:thiamine biosynthesis lipoprotein
MLKGGLARFGPIEARSIAFESREGLLEVARFGAMGSPCELLVRNRPREAVEALAALAAGEAWRIERKFSRYREDSVVAAIHAADGAWVDIDAETEGLLAYAIHCHQLSEGRFDITSGVLREAWTFDGSDRLPDPALVMSLLSRVGQHRMELRPGALRLPAGMQIDLGGIAKEYAVDRALEGLLREDPELQVLVNFGGDLRASGCAPGQAWQVAIERVGTDGGQSGASSGASVDRPYVTARKAAHQPPPLIELTLGALATSGDAHRYLLREGRRYSHILDPRSGWPVEDAPHSVTVAAATCVEAGSLCTLAVLMGNGAESFLEGLGVPCWIQR